MPVGETRDAGWQIGVSVTVHREAVDVWDYLTSRSGIEAWLGAGVAFRGSNGETYCTDDGVVGEVRSFRPLDRIRMTWQPAEWDHDSTVQIALDDKGDRTRIVFHQERLADAGERELQRRHWKAVSDQVKVDLSHQTGMAD